MMLLNVGSGENNVSSPQFKTYLLHIPQYLTAEDGNDYGNQRQFKGIT